jgi:hypothetical protein
MKRFGPQLFLFSLFVAAAITLSCGTSPGRVLESVSVSPMQADAQGGMIQFTATGSYTRPPSPVALAR